MNDENDDKMGEAANLQQTHFNFMLLLKDHKP